MDYDQCDAAADAKVRLYTFAAVVALLEGGTLPGGSKSAYATANKIIKLCKDEQQRQLCEWNRLSERAAKKSIPSQDGQK